MAGLLLRVLITEHIQVVVYQTAYGKILKCLSDLETYTSSTRVPEGVRLIFFWGGGSGVLFTEHIQPVVYQIAYGRRDFKMLV